MKQDLLDKALEVSSQILSSQIYGHEGTQPQEVIDAIELIADMLQNLSNRKATKLFDRLRQRSYKNGLSMKKQLAYEFAKDAVVYLMLKGDKQFTACQKIAEKVLFINAEALQKQMGFPASGLKKYIQERYKEKSFNAVIKTFHNDYVSSHDIIETIVEEAKIRYKLYEQESSLLQQIETFDDKDYLGKMRFQDYMD